MRRYRDLLILLLLTLGLVPAAEAQWRRAGLFGADVRALIVDPSEPDTLYLGTSDGDVYVSNDAGKNWRSPRGGNPFPGYVVDNLVLDRKGRLWAACWGLWGGGVIAVSDDGGKSWIRRDAGLEGFSVRAIAIDPNDENFILAGGLTGVYRSMDSGLNWERISDQINVESLAIDPRTRDRLYIGTWRQGLRSDDGGQTWAHINQGMVLDTDMFSITIDSHDPDNVWVATCGWVYNSRDRGDHWKRYRDGFSNRRIHDVEIDPCDRNRIYAGSVGGLYRSEDGGQIWYPVSDEQLVINTVVLHPQRPDRIILGVEGDGVYVSHDGARTFARSSIGLRNVHITTIAADPRSENRVYASVVFGGTASGIYVSDDAGATWSKLSVTRLPEVLSLTVAAEAEGDVRFVAGTEKGFFWSRDGAEWQQSDPVNVPLRASKVLRFNRQRMFAGTSEGVFTSRDGGKSWYRLARASDRAVDIALGYLGGKKALIALTSTGVRLFDGEKWTVVNGAPTRGSSLATRTVKGSQVVFVAGLEGVKAGTIDENRQWHEVEVPDAQQATVLGATRSSAGMLFLTSRQHREILVGDTTFEDWLELTLPTRTAEVSSIATDPFNHDRLYVGTLGEGIFIYEGKPQKYVAKKRAPSETATAAAASSGSQQ